MKLKDSREFPIYLIFNSSYSSLAGIAKNFQLPILDSKIVQLNETTFLMTTPTGWIWPFLRKSRSNILEGPSGWIAEIKGDIIAAKAPCGDSLKFSNGKLVEHQTKSITLNFIYSKDGVSEILQNGDILATINYSEKNGRAERLIFTDRSSIALDWGHRPDLQTVAGQRVIGRFQDSIVGFRSTEGKTHSLAFSLSKDLVSELRVDDGPAISWGDNGIIISDGYWLYKIKQLPGFLSYASIQRSGQNGIEFWEKIPEKGVEIFQTADGNKKTVHRFTSGILARSIRKVENEFNGILKTVYSASYLENGKLGREQIGQTEFEYKYDELQRLVSVSKNGKLFKEREYKDGKLNKEKYTNGLIRQYEYTKNFVQITNTAPNGTVYYETKNL